MIQREYGCKSGFSGFGDVLKNTFIYIAKVYGINMTNKEIKPNLEVLSYSEQDNAFINSIAHEAAFSCNNIRDSNFNLAEAKNRTQVALTALGSSNGLQAMLTAQMLAIHQLQQKSMAYANAIDDIKTKQYYVSSSIKLSNCFVQQAGLLAKLQGIAGQKIIVERVDVHQGGQAIVGSVQGGMGKKEKT